MAKNILGKSGNDNPFETICSECGCHFTFGKSDVYPHKSEDRDGTSIDNYVDCPQCNHSIMSDDITKPVKGGGGMFGAYTKQNIQQMVLKQVNVSTLRATTDDNEFKRKLINMLR